MTKWQFVARFRYHAFGWQSDKPILRIKEALSEIKEPWLTGLLIPWYLSLPKPP